MIRTLAASYARLVIAALTMAYEAEPQEAETKSSTTATQAEAKQSPPFVASLLLIKSDWSQSPFAKEIDTELHQAWGEQPEILKPGEKRQIGPGNLFFTTVASIYTEQHYAQLLAWLKARQLFHQIQPFQQSPASPSDEAYTLGLSKNTEFFGVSPRGKQENPFFTRTSEFIWNIKGWTTTWYVERLLLQFEKGRGQDKPQLANMNEYDRCHLSVEPLEEGHVLIVHAFPAKEDWEYLNAAALQGFEALIVFEKRISPASESAEPRLHLPDKVERIKAERMRGSSFGGMGQGYMPPAKGPKSAGPPSRYITSKGVMISWSEAKDIAWGFSKSLGRWAEQKLDPPATDPRGMVVDDDLAVWRVGSVYYAFSGEAGRWNILRLPEGHTPPPILDTGFARVHDGDDVYTFANSTGRWSSPKDSTASQPATADSVLAAKKLELEG